MKFTFFQCIYVNIVLYAKKKHSIFTRKIAINKKKPKIQKIGYVFLNYNTQYICNTNNIITRCLSKLTINFNF